MSEKIPKSHKTRFHKKLFEKGRNFGHKIETPRIHKKRKHPERELGRQIEEEKEKNNDL